MVFESVEYGTVLGVIDWGDVAAEVRGTYAGDHVVFEDYAIRRTNGAAYELFDRKDVHIRGGVMEGTDKNGRWRLRAVRIP